MDTGLAKVVASRCNRVGGLCSHAELASVLDDHLGVESRMTTGGRGKQVPDGFWTVLVPGAVAYLSYKGESNPRSAARIYELLEDLGFLKYVNRDRDSILATIKDPPRRQISRADPRLRHDRRRISPPRSFQARHQKHGRRLSITTKRQATTTVPPTPTKQ